MFEQNNDFGITAETDVNSCVSLDVQKDDAAIETDC
jgi:hypothetical protein